MDTPSSLYQPRKWYSNPVFPLVPELTTKKGDGYNTPGFSFSWLFFKVWSLDAFSFELAFEISEHWGIGFTAILPYLRIVACIPCPPKIGMWAQRNLWRKP